MFYIYDFMFWFLLFYFFAIHILDSYFVYTDKVCYHYISNLGQNSHISLWH